jgi:hypothetical protein
MNSFICPTRGSSWLAVVMLASSLSTVASAQAVEGSPSDLEPGDAIVAREPAQPMAATGTAADIAALRAEVDALKAKQEEAETAALLNQSEVTDQATERELVHVYGFMDFGIDKFFISSKDGLSVLRPTPATTFVFGNLNLYFAANPVEHLRTMVEIRLTLAPHGEETDVGPPIGTSYERVDTTAFEFSDPSSQSELRLGGLYIERAWTEYQFSNLFKLQWGLFLNPFGIWNLDHGSPTLISLMLPEFIASQMMPTRLLGVHLYGSTFFGGSELGYALHITNGRTPLDFDLSEDKAVGARLYFAHEGEFGRLVLGVSNYWGTYLDQQRQFTPQLKSFVSQVDVVSFTEDVLGFDVALDVGDLRVRSELVLRWIKYDDGKSEQAITSGGSFGFLPNRMEYAGYVMAAYRTPWHLEPYVEAETSSKAAVVPRWAGAGYFGEANSAALFLSVGVNVELTTHTLFKTQVVWDRAYDRHFKNKVNDSPILFIRVVESF